MRLLLPSRKFHDRIPTLSTGRLLSDDPANFATYAIEVLNASGRGAGLSNQVKVSLVRTLPRRANSRHALLAQGVVLTWANEPQATGVSAITSAAVHYVYRVYRRQLGNPDEILAGQIAAGSEPILTLTDSDIDWGKTYEYRAETLTVIARENKPELQVDGDDTPEIKVFADDVFPPAVPAGLQAVASGPGQKTFVDLVWAPVTDVDLGGYNVYRHEEGAVPVKVNAAPVKTPAYRDASVVSGKSYLYSVSAVDVRGNESARSEEAGESVP